MPSDFVSFTSQAANPLNSTSPFPNNSASNTIEFLNSSLEFRETTLTAMSIWRYIEQQRQNHALYRSPPYLGKCDTLLHRPGHADTSDLWRVGCTCQTRSARSSSRSVCQSTTRHQHSETLSPLRQRERRGHFAPPSGTDCVHRRLCD